MTTQDCLVNVFPRICCQLKQSEYAVAGFYNERQPDVETVSGINFRIIFWPRSGDFFLLKSQIFSTEVCKLIADWRDKAAWSHLPPIGEEINQSRGPVFNILWLTPYQQIPVTRALHLSRLARVRGALLTYLYIPCCCCDAVSTLAGYWHIVIRPSLDTRG